MCNHPYVTGDPGCWVVNGWPRDECSAPVAANLAQCDTGCRDVRILPVVARDPDCCAVSRCPRVECPAPVAASMAQGDTGCHEYRLMAQSEQRLSSACPDDFLQKELVDLLEHARETRIWSRSSRRIGARANPPLCSRRFWLLRSERIPSRRATCTCHCEHGSVRYRMPRRAQPALCGRRSGLLRCERRPSRRVPCACRCDRRNQLFVSR